MKKALLILSAILWAVSAMAQMDPLNGTGSTVKLNDDGSHYLKFTLTNQVWARYNESNPGTTVSGTPKSETFDIGIRRSRIQMYGAINKRSFVYVQLGMNNFNHLSDRKVGLFFHDVIAEYAVVKDKLSIGGGLTNWVGLSRLSNASVVTFMPMDSPIFPFATIDATDQFNRKLSLYAKGKLGKLDYRLAVTDPMNFEKSTLYSATSPISRHSNFATGAANKQFQGYLMYQFWDQESNLTPYTVGSYLGTKRVFNLGAGYIFQHNAMWRTTGPVDTVKTDMALVGADVFLDLPLRKEAGDALTAYASVYSNNYGQGYLRNNGIMNPATGTIASQASFNGAGNAFPLFGTGTVYYTQIGYLLGKGWANPEKLRIQPYFCYMLGDYDRLDKPMQMTNAGINFFLNNHNAKVTLDWQQRPVYLNSTSGPLPFSGRKNSVTLQFQVAI
ncbi:MAG: hypothetical protein RLZZ543_831 [Bacteroidota bacterium]|jgi:hypothetical protein